MTTADELREAAELTAKQFQMAPATILTIAIYTSTAAIVDAIDRLKETHDRSA